MQFLFETPHGSAAMRAGPGDFISIQLQQLSVAVGHERIGDEALRLLPLVADRAESGAITPVDLSGYSVCAVCAILRAFAGQQQHRGPGRLRLVSGR
jgi:hypothetical protein